MEGREIDGRKVGGPVTSEEAYPAERDPGVARMGGRGARRAFLAAALRNPGQFGALAPSSPSLAAVIASVAPTTGAPVVVELGPGTGAMTTAIEGRLAPGARHLAIELDPRMVGFLRQAHPGLEVVEGDAVKLQALLAERGIEQADAVLSGLPWALFDDATQVSILAQVAAVIEPDGVFATFAYRTGMALAAARRFRRTLHATFAEVEITPTVWRNMPPAFVYVCRRPRVL
jgi:phosphatidylethanolamine/phosphatidyl-N-methylethanolamine N-methyltransferase